MWYATLTPASLDDAAQTLTLQIETSEPKGPLIEHGIKDQAQVFLFSNPPIDGINKAKSAFDKNSHRYFGEFTVNGLVVGEEGKPANNNLPLRATIKMTDAEWAQLRQGAGDIVLYDAMPSDQHDAFLGFSEEDLRSFLPESTVEQYLADGKDIEKFPNLKNDPELSQAVEDGVDPTTGAAIKVFRRPLRNYDVAFRDFNARLTDINNELVIVSKELEYATRAKTRGEEEIKKLDGLKETANAELAVLQREKAIAEAHLKTLDTKVAELTQELKNQLTTNKRLTEEIAGQKTTMISPPADAATGLASASISAIGTVAAAPVE
jgi:hypothetical protein